MFLDMPLKLMIPTKKESQLRKKGFNTYGELLRFFPIRYEDRSKIIPFTELLSHIDEKVTLVGTVSSIRVDYGKRPYVQIKVSDKISGVNVGIYFFHQLFIQNRYAVGQRIIVYGKLTEKYGNFSLSAEYHTKNIDDIMRPTPIYGKVTGMSYDYLRDCIKQTMQLMKESDEPVEDLSLRIRQQFGIDDVFSFFEKVHFPKTMSDVDDTYRRRDVETLYPVVRGLEQKARVAKDTTDKVANSPDAVKGLLDQLPYELTADQQQLMHLMLDIMSSGKRMDILLQADVGAGKTVCAALAIANVIGSGYQAAIMAPTSVLAEQHFKEFSGYFPGKTVLLSSKLKVKERRTLLKQIASGEVSVVIGTHAVISKDVQYANLALTVVDEEHRFGVEQREMLREKADEGAHCLSMSATPIPRSLALAVYGSGVQVFDIHTMPPGRKPVQTFQRRSEECVFRAIQRQIDAGHQAYIVCPAIESNEKIPNVASIDDILESLNAFFAGTTVKIACIHGNMKQADIDAEIAAFANGERDILLSTTIVEVGINVPNATVMTVINAERFGLAQLHQLRGRVGRSSDQGYCVLVSEKDTPRLKTMLSTTDGFAIAQADLQLRGSGNLIGTAQSGMDRAVELIVEQPELYKTLKSLVEAELDAEMPA